MEDTFLISFFFFALVERERRMDTQKKTSSSSSSRISNIIMSTFSTTLYQSIEAEAKDIARLAKGGGGGGGGGNGALFFGLLAMTTTTAPQPAVRAAAESVVAGVRAVARHTDEKAGFETHEVGAFFFVVVFVLRRLDDDEDSRAFLEVVAETRKARRFLSLSLSLRERAVELVED